jgi:tetratricopeptide (TPR) repeat protein
MIRKSTKRSCRAALLTVTLALVTGTTGRVIAADHAQLSVIPQAEQLARAGRTEEAVKLLQTALAARPTDLEVRLALAGIYAKNSQGDQAEQEYREALRLHPGSSSAALALAAFYIAHGVWTPAEQVLDQALQQYPKLTEAHTQLALVLARQHKYQEAQANITLVPAPTEPNARVRYFRLAASIDSGLGNSLAAAQAMENALHVTPADEDLQLITAIAEAEASEWPACIRNIAPLYKKHPSPRSGLVLLRAELASHGNFAPTLQSLRTLNLPVNQELELRVHSAELLASADRHMEAIDELQQALRIAGPGDETLLYNLAVEQYSARQFDKASATLNALRTQNDSAEIEDLIGDVDEQRGDRAAAVHSHESAVALAPQEERFRLSLGAELLKYQQYQSAVSVFQQAVELFPNSVRSYVGLGMASYFMERYDESVAAFLRADKLDGGAGRALNYLGATQVDNPAGPAPAALEAICGRADSDKAEATTVAWCGALLFRKAYLDNNQAAAPDLIRRLRIAAKLAPDNSVANCSLGQALEWTEQLAEARHWLEICVRARPDSTEAHYRLSRVYLGLGLKQAAAEQADLIDTANAEHDQHQTMANTFADEVLTPSGHGQAAHPR